MSTDETLILRDFLLRGIPTFGPIQQEALAALDRLLARLDATEKRIANLEATMRSVRWEIVSHNKTNNPLTAVEQIDAALAVSGTKEEGACSNCWNGVTIPCAVGCTDTDECCDKPLGGSLPLRARRQERRRKRMTNREEIQRRVRDLAELAETALDWTVHPTSDSPACVPVGALRDELADLDRDLTADLLEAHHVRSSDFSAAGLWNRQPRKRRLGGVEGRHR